MAYLGKTPSQAVRSRYYFTATGGETSLSGTDDNSNTLTFTDGNYVDVSLNGVALVAGTDYNTTTANTIGGLTALTASDVVEIVVYDTFSVFSGAFTGDISLGDNVKATFGDAAGGDMDIFHDGSNSVIRDRGQGDLKILGTNVQLKNADDTESYLDCTNNGGVRIFHDNSLTLNTTSTGIDVTGTVTADAATLSGTSPVLSYSDTDNSITAQIGSGTSDFNIATTSAHNLDIRTNNTRRMVVESDGDIIFYDSTGVTQGLFWDASTQRLGLGTTSPAATFQSTKSTSNGSIGVAAIMDAGTLNPSVSGGGIVINFRSNSGASYFGGVGGYTDGTNYVTGLWGGAAASGAPSLSVNSSGNVGIGTTSPASYSSGGSNFVVANSNSGANAVGMSLVNPNGAVGTSVSLDFVPNTNIALASISSPRTAANGATDLAFNTYTGSSMTEKVRILSSGRLLVGTTNSSPHNISSGTVGGCSFGEDNGGEIATDAYNCFQVNKLSSTSGSLIAFRYNATQVGYISTNGSTTSYNTSSDHRLKENVADMTGAIDRVKALAPKRFNFIADADKTVDGFLAHEAQAVVPEAVTGTHNEVDDDGNPVMQGIDQSKLVPLLTGALQEAIAKIEALETSNADLIARIETLENA